MEATVYFTKSSVSELIEFLKEINESVNDINSLDRSELVYVKAIEKPSQDNSSTINIICFGVTREIHKQLVFTNEYSKKY